jgi:hypothetical protein
MEAPKKELVTECPLSSRIKNTTGTNRDPNKAGPARNAI